MEGSATLWDSPLKEVKISAEALKGIESSSNTSFSSLENLFVHEIWELSRKYLDTKIIGFSFINKGSKGQVSYGFIDYKDVVEILDKSNIPCNANGAVNTTFREAIQSKVFNFSIVQFGNDDFKNNPANAFKIQKQLFGNPEVELYKDQGERTKYKTLSYEIHAHGGEQNALLFSALSYYFTNNLETFYNMAGEESTRYLKKNPSLSFSKMQVTELYKSEKGKISSELTSIQLYTEGKPLQATSVETYRKMGITVMFKPIDLYLTEKNYGLSIVSINAEELNKPLEESANIIKKLNAGQWSDLVKH